MSLVPKLLLPTAGLLLVAGCRAPAPVPVAAPPVPSAIHGRSLQAVAFEGDPSFVEATRAALALSLRIHPEVAADAGLLADGLTLPSFAPDVVQQHLEAIDAHLARLDALDEERLSVAERIDVLVVKTALEADRHALTVERRWTHRPAEWLEPVSTLLMAHLASPEPLPGAIDTLATGIPALVEEMKAELTRPTRRDVQTAEGLLTAIEGIFAAQPPSDAVTAARQSLEGLRVHLTSQADLPEMQMIGPEAYRWRLAHTLHLPWDAETLLAMAEADLEWVNRELDSLAPHIEPTPPPTADERARAEGLDQAGVNALVDELVQAYLERLRGMDVLTVPGDLPPLRARPTPDALIPLTGDGGSMNPVPPFGPTDGAWWNIEHFPAHTTPQHRLDRVLVTTRADATWYGPYAAHEGVPGHHLQLAINRDNPRPVRRLAHDTAAVEGWALYAESLFEAHGGLGDTVAGRAATLRSFRARVKRVVFDVKVETGVWTLQEAADWKHGAAPGEGRVDPELLRTVQWPTQLITYYAGMKGIEALREDCRTAWGTEYSDRRFHDALLAEGSIPVVWAGWAMGCTDAP